MSHFDSRHRPSQPVFALVKYYQSPVTLIPSHVYLYSGVTFWAHDTWGEWKLKWSQNGSIFFICSFRMRPPYLALFMINVINSNCAGCWWSLWYLGWTGLLLSVLDVTGRDDIMCHMPSTISLSRCRPAPEARDGARIRTIIVQTLHNNIGISRHAIYNATPFSIQRSLRGHPLHYLAM